MIYTLTLNPAIDYTVFLDTLTPGRMHRTKREKITFGGKGINVSRMLQALGVPNIAWGFAAGSTGQALLKGLAEEQIQNDFIISAEGNTRINVKIEASEETEINGVGPAISESEFALLLRKLKGLSPADTLVLSGSAPASVSSAMYETLLQAIAESGARLVADVSGAALPQVLRFRPYLIKPNLAELSELSGTPLLCDAEIRKAAVKITERGISLVLVSLGAEGAVLATDSGEFYTEKAPQGKVRSTVGCGDALLAAFLRALRENPSDLSNALKAGVLTGSAVAFTEPGTPLQHRQIQSLFKKSEKSFM